MDKINKSTSTKVETVHKSEKVIFKAPVKGKFEDITQVKDEVFSQKMMVKVSQLNKKMEKSTVQLMLLSFQSSRPSMLLALKQNLV